MMHPFLFKTVGEVWRAPKQESDVGVELELEGRNLPNGGIPGWTVKPEGSLRGEAFEYVTTSAVMIEPTLRRRLTRLNKMFEDMGSEVRLSKRGSTHIHLNLQNESFRVFFGVILVFSLIEPVLLRLCGPTRNGNLFCMPSYETAELPRYVAGIVNAVKTKSITHGWPGSRGKYASLNTDAMVNFGSVEFRCFPNSINTDEIVKWATWTTNIRRIAREWPDLTFRSLLDYPKEDPEGFLNLVFVGEDNIRSRCSPQTIPELLQLGIEGAYEIFRQLRPLIHYNSDVEKEERKKRKELNPPWPGAMPVFDEDGNVLEWN